ATMGERGVGGEVPGLASRIVPVPSREPVFGELSTAAGAAVVVLAGAAARDDLVGALVQGAADALPAGGAAAQDRAPQGSGLAPATNLVALVLWQTILSRPGHRAASSDHGWRMPSKLTRGASMLST